ncbi:MAG: hypothetical protein ACKVW3_00970 [Phycisphaerales bacterium]
MKLLACIAALAMLLGPLGSWARSQCESGDPAGATSCCVTSLTPACCGESDADSCESDADSAPSRDGLPCDPGSGCWWLCAALCNAVIDPLPLPSDSGFSVAIALLPSAMRESSVEPALRVLPISGAPPDPMPLRLARLCRWLT